MNDYPSDAASAKPDDSHERQRHAELQDDLEAAAESLRIAILACEPEALIGYFWAQLLMRAMLNDGAFTEDAEALSEDEADDCGSLDDLMFALEYVHAVLSAHPTEAWGHSRDAGQMGSVLAIAMQLRADSLIYCLSAAQQVPDNLLGDSTREFAMHAMTSWVTIRGHRYQSLEEEFFAFVLAPHDDALNKVYGLSAIEIAKGIQAAVDETRRGHMRAADQLEAAAGAAHGLAEREGIELGQAMARMQAETPELMRAAQQAAANLFFGGICDVGRSSGLPSALLDDLSYEPGTETEFFGEGPLRGTPLRRMPGRVKPLVRLNGRHFACDANFIRDSAYRALQWGLHERLPDYKREWTERQTVMSEGAFLRIFEKQLEGAESWTSFYYRDPNSGEWVENDLLVLMEDVLLQIEVKAGVMPMHSPELHFERHARAIRDLVIKAYGQCERFLRYAASADEVPIYRLVGGAYVEVKRLRLADYRVVLPVGLTVEAFTPISSMCKRLEAISPILGKHPFVSMSIDDLFVLSRFLPTAGELLHYMVVRQSVAGLKDVYLHDELDHLGAYVLRNRADAFYSEQLGEGSGVVVDSDTCQLINDYFADPDWEGKPPPSQSYPLTLRLLFRAMDADRGAGFLLADSTIRDFSDQQRTQLARELDGLLPTLPRYQNRWVMLDFGQPILVWLQSDPSRALTAKQRAAAQAFALAREGPSCKVIRVGVGVAGQFLWASCAVVAAPDPRHPQYRTRMTEAEALRHRARPA